MPRVPTASEIKDIAMKFSMHLSDEEITVIQTAIKLLLLSYNELDGINDNVSSTLHAPYPRSWRRPNPQENSYGAIAFFTDIKGRDQGKLAGKKVCVKDNVMIAGVPMLHGTKVLEGFVPEIDATVVIRILDEGGHIVAKTTCEALSFSGGSFTSYPMLVRNPANPEYMSGGSSSGAAVAVATGVCDVAIGADQGGSIRVPSAWTGVYGLKPTYGLVPYTGIATIEPTLDHAGPIARKVEDLALTLEVIAGRDDLDPRQPSDLPKPPVKPYSKLLTGNVKGLRVGIVKEGFEWPVSEEDVNKAVRETANKLRSLGITVEEVSIPMHKLGVAIWTPLMIEGTVANMFLASGVAWRGGYLERQLAGFFGNALKSMADELPLNVKAGAVLGYYMITKYNNTYYAKARNLALDLRRAYDDALMKYDALLMPTTPQKPLRFVDNPTPELMLLMTAGMLYNTAPFDVTGHPALSIPCCKLDGLPIGMMLITKHLDEEIILNIAYAAEISRLY
ncbi:MAG: amidase [Vulcanisaeta sp.]|uniref:amidase n=1 Tax=Vulcanisaeta sp. TaxID=2020871 RepID=UPI003D143AC1